MEGTLGEQAERGGVSAEICKDQKNDIAARSIFSQVAEWKEPPAGAKPSSISCQQMCIQSLKYTQTHVQMQESINTHFPFQTF